MTRSNQSPDPLDGQVCFSLVDSVDDDDDIECSENPFVYGKNQNKPRKNY